jgi:hypothetical protein
VADPKKTTKRSGSYVIFYGSLILLAIFVGLGIYYLVPEIYHPFTSDTATQSYAHVKWAAASFVGAIIFLIVARLARPNA